ncbi:MAG: DUF434 domain-containing protein [Spirochaetaceae bacterium]
MSTDERIRPAFGRAVADYALFIERGYPVKGVLKLVGDRYRLSGTERTILYRGVVSRACAEARRRRMIAPEDIPRGSTIIVDGHNVLFTVVNYLQGRPVFIAVDGYLRDAGNPARRIQAGEDYRRAVSELGERFRGLDAGRIAVYFDEPVTYSKDHIGTARQAWADLGEKLELHLVRSADHALTLRAADLIATSDSTLIDRSPVPLVDFARWIVEDGLAATIPRLADYLGERG